MDATADFSIRIRIRLRSPISIPGSPWETTTDQPNVPAIALPRWPGFHARSREEKGRHEQQREKADPQVVVGDRR